MTLLDDILPRFDHRETHGIRVTAPAARALEAVREVTPADAPLLRFLFALRGLPASAQDPVWAQLTRRGFFELAEEPGRELVAGAIGRPWKLLEPLLTEWVIVGGTSRFPRTPSTGPLARTGGFAAWREPGWAKMALGFRAADGLLTTETRVLLTDDDARRRFARYWGVVEPLSGLTRRSWLAAAKRHAELSS